MKNKEEPSANSSRGNTPSPASRYSPASQRAETTRSLSRPRRTATARADQPALSLFPESLMEAVVDPANMERAWKNVRANRGAPGPDGITIAEFPEWLRPRWPEIRQQLLDGTYRPAQVPQRVTGSAFFARFLLRVSHYISVCVIFGRRRFRWSSRIC